MSDLKLKVPINPGFFEVKSDFAIKWEESRPAKYQEYRKKWAENPKNFILEQGPIHLSIETTNACNLKCSMCPRTIMLESENSSKSDFKIGFMDMKLYKKIIDEAAKIGVYSLKLNRRGEPLIHQDIVEMVAYAKEKGFVDVMFNTNATMLNEKISRDLILAGLDKIFFSFDSPDKKKYEEIRVGADYEVVLNNIINFVKLRNELKSDVPLTRVSMVLMEENKHEYHDFVNLFKDTVDCLSHSYLRKPLAQEDIDKHNSVKSKNVLNFACSQLWQRMFIHWDGEVTVCCVDYEEKYPVGNVTNQFIQEIWGNKNYKFIRDKHLKGKYYKIPMCSDCSLTSYS